MERLIKSLEDGKLDYLWEFNGVNGCYDIWDEDLLTKQIDRLADYEATGLEPKDVEYMRNELCLKCGKYKEAHLDACDGCRWKKDG